VRLISCLIGFGGSLEAAINMTFNAPSLTRILLVFGLLGPFLGGLGLGWLLAEQSAVRYEGTDIVFRVLVVGLTALLLSVVLSLPLAFAVHRVFRAIASNHELHWYLRGIVGIVVGGIFSIYPWALGYRDIRICVIGAVVGFVCGVLCLVSRYDPGT